MIIIISDGQVKYFTVYEHFQSRLYVVLYTTL